MVGIAARAAACTLIVSMGLAAGACGSRLPRPVADPGSVAATSVTSSSVAPSSVVARPSTTTSPPTTTASAPRPPYSVTVVTLHLVDSSRPTVSKGRQISPTRALTTLVWLPQGAGRWPLVVFAHGFQVGPQPYATLLAAWAAHGYVVAAPEFPLTDGAIAGANLDEGDIGSQPGDVRFVTDFLVSPDSPLVARIDSARVAVAGHSDGAETALAASVADLPPGEPRYRAVIVMSVQPLAGTGPTGNPPILVTQGDADTINPPTYGYQTWQQARSPRYLLVLHGGGHLPPLEAGSAWLPGIEAETEAFLDAYVAGDGTVARVDAAAGGAGASLFSLRSG